MVDMRKAAIRAYRKYFGSPTADEEHAAGAHAVMNGETAVLLCETAISQALVTCRSDRPDGELALNAFQHPVTAMQAEGPRGMLACATGLAMAGRRAAVFMDGTGLPAGQDLLYSAAGRHLALVIHLVATLPPGHGAAAGGAHDSFHLAGESGCFTLFARNVQEAVDFSFIARRVAEQTLVPAVVAMDANETAWAPQDVHLLSVPQIRQFVGAPDEIVPVATAAQGLLFGETRRRVPRWHDTDRPVLQGATHTGDGYALGALGRRVFFEDFLPACLETSFGLFETLTGRHYETVSHYRTRDAGVVFVAQGAALETLEATADYLREHSRVKVGVLGISGLRPVPADVAAHLHAAKSVVVFERTLPPAGAEGALAREVRSVLGAGANPPRIHTAIYGIGGLPLRREDIALVVPRLDTAASPIALGVEFARRERQHPKRQVLLDALARAYPGLEQAGLRERDAVRVPLGEDTLAFAIQTGSDDALADLAGDIGEVLHHDEGGMVRARIPQGDPAWGEDRVSYLVHNPDSLRDPGDEGPIDVLVLGPGDGAVRHELARRLRPGALVVAVDIEDAELGGRLARLFDAGAADEIHFVVARRDDSDTSRGEFALGAVFGALVQSGKKELKARRLIASRPEPSRDAFQQGFNACAIVDPSDMGIGEAANAARWDKPAPAAVRALGRGDDQFDSLPRFWDQVGVLYNDDETDELTVDPYFATGTVAPLSATFRDLSGMRSQIPLFEAPACTGCGKCWSVCPDGALGAVSLGASALLETGARVGGGEALRPVLGQLATRMTAQARKGELACRADDAVRTEYAWLEEKMSLTPERAETLSAAAEKVAAALGDLPLAVTEPLFARAEQVKKDGGELLSLAVNADVCKGCGICIDQCDAGALSLSDQSPAELAAARGRWETWAATPDTAAATIERLMEDGGMDRQAALGLSRHCLNAMAGGDGAEAGSGEKIALRMVLAAAEFHAEPLLNRLAHDANEAARGLVQHIREILSSALPGDDLNALETTLGHVSSPSMTLSTLARDIEAATEGTQLETAELRRLTRLAEDLTTLQHRIAQGEQGLGRARFGLAIAPGTVAGWAAQFPWNPFQSPVVMDMTGDTAQLAAGLLQGHIQDTCEASAMLRRAKLEVDHPAGADFERAALDRIRWEDLTEEERRSCPPLIVVGTDEVFAGYGLSEVLSLLRSSLPVKIVCLSSLDKMADLPMLAVAVCGAYVSSTSIGDAAHLQASVAAALSWGGPALIHIHAPSPARHGFAPDQTIRQAIAAVASRAHPLFTYDPRVDGVHGTRISLDGNPDVETLWPVIDDTAVTPVHWALTEHRFDAWLTPLAADQPGVDLADYLALERPARDGKTAVLAIDATEGKTRYAVAPQLIAMVETAAQAWRVLQELSGTVTPFTDRVKEQARQEVAAEHTAELDALRADYEQKIAGLADGVRTDVANKIRGQLMRLVRTDARHG